MVQAEKVYVLAIKKSTLHEASHEFELKAKHPLLGADLCLISSVTFKSKEEIINTKGVKPLVIIDRTEKA
ncbi:hypothetical protein LRS76_15235 [Bacillus amyloliquefaciens]|uniref:hypothetical protein n=1 Tax=Bacillus subtilis group TaxID=653685 RepID=UPI001E2CFCAD|nr:MULTISPECIES: hypothetical protein [Bacillus subtilis group]MCC8308221.1 hypothetical protein [Bacillus velezensis]MCD5429068.1 hypothetical protein [Bacillus amyloliquefaciens]MCO7130692.1 hypothetical protein [Bacillus velezensis]MCO7138573.1 hypothetical protein [Bacillus velezensis]MCS4322812.1 hypothetical protein [Bacillus subtilis]